MMEYQKVLKAVLGYVDSGNSFQINLSRQEGKSAMSMAMKKVFDKAIQNAKEAYDTESASMYQDGTKQREVE